jgi:hypothetical protein
MSYIGIAEAILRNLAPWQTPYDTAGVPSHPLAEDVTVRVADAYYQSIASLCDEKEANGQSAIRVTYTG